MRPARRSTAQVDRPAQLGRPAGARPQRPEQLLRRGARPHLLAGVEQQLGQRPCAHDPGALSPSRNSGLHDDAYRTSSRACAAYVPSAPAAPSRGCGAAARAGAGLRRRGRPGPQQQALDPGRVEVVDVVDVAPGAGRPGDHGAQRVEQWQDGEGSRTSGTSSWPPRPGPRRTERGRSGGIEVRRNGPGPPSGPRGRRLEVGAASRSARCPASARSVSKVRISTRPSPRGSAGSRGASGRGTRRAPRDAARQRASRPATRCDATSRRGPNRRVVRSATTSAGARRRGGRRPGKSRIPRTSAPRNP